MTEPTERRDGPTDEDALALACSQLWATCRMECEQTGERWCAQARRLAGRLGRDGR